MEAARRRTAARRAAADAAAAEAAALDAQETASCPPAPTKIISPDRIMAQTVRLPASMWAELSAVARRQGIPRSVLVRGMIYCELLAFRGAGGLPPVL